ncbi:MAG: prepilin-type N-terminal cleavage/methylation domain-containing protein [Microbacterium sp.]|nr:MAG: prepilin-type N-terminal cleavage/methylation domain-containing protein [Microbacterium sp.]
MFQRSDDDGFSLVEVVMAMFLLTLLALAVLPLFISATRMSVANRDSIEATALADAHLSALRAQFPPQPITATTCAGLVTAATRLVDTNPATLPNITVPAGLTRHVAVESCPTGTAAGKPAAVLVTVRISNAAGTNLATLRTRIPVSSA